jgi:hypothetical protein
VVRFIPTLALQTAAAKAKVVKMAGYIRLMPCFYFFDFFFALFAFLR